MHSYAMCIIFGSFLLKEVIYFCHFHYFCSAILFCCRYRVQNDRNVAICSVHPSVQATLQCLGCLKAKIPVAKSYHCSTKCFSDAWQHHRALHDRATSAVNDNVNEDEELFGRYNNTGPGVINANLSGAVSSTSLTNGSTPFILHPLRKGVVVRLGSKLGDLKHTHHQLMTLAMSSSLSALW